MGMYCPAPATGEALGGGARGLLWSLFKGECEKENEALALEVEELRLWWEDILVASLRELAVLVCGRLLQGFCGADILFEGNQSLFLCKQLGQSQQKWCCKDGNQRERVVRVDVDGFRMRYVLSYNLPAFSTVNIFSQSPLTNENQEQWA
jgi:hypothetical protein